jgi:hypothetical protein
MNVDSFCFAALLKTRDDIAELLRMLPENVQDEVDVRMNEFRGLSEAELRDRWIRLRTEEARVWMARAHERTGIEPTNLSPRLRIGFISMLGQVK